MAATLVTPPGARPTLRSRAAAVPVRPSGGPAGGGELPLCDAYLSDLLPARVRGKLIGWAYTAGFCGVPVAGCLALGVVPHSFIGLAGWRWMFLIGGVGALLCWILRRSLPESPRWLAAVGRYDEAEAIVARLEAGAGIAEREPAPAAPAVVKPPKPASPVRELFSARWRRRTVMLGIFQILQVFGYYGFGTLAPLVLASKGYDIVHSIAFSAVTFLGRLATAVMPYVLLPLLDGSGPTAVFIFIACAMAAIVVDIGVLGPRTTGRSLTGISGEPARSGPAPERTASAG